MRLLLILACLLAAGGAQANHPMITDDTEVLDKGVWQLELHGQRLRNRESGATLWVAEASVAVAYGAAKDLQLQVEQPYLSAAQDDGSGRVETRGWADLQLELKWNFYEHAGLGLSLKPQVSLPTGADDVGGKHARFGVALLAAKELGKFELMGQLAHVRNRNDEGQRESLWRVSAALVWAATERLRLFVDFVDDTHPTPGSGDMRSWVYGLLYDVSSAVDFGLGVKNNLNESADGNGLLAGLRLRW